MSKEQQVKDMEEKLAQINNVLNTTNASPQLTTEEVYGIDSDGKMSITHRKLIVSPRPASSVEFSMDSKGTIKPYVKVYHEDPTRALELSKEVMKKALQAAHEIVAED